MINIWHLHYFTTPFPFSQECPTLTSALWPRWYSSYLIFAHGSDGPGRGTCSGGSLGQNSIMKINPLKATFPVHIRRTFDIFLISHHIILNQINEPLVAPSQNIEILQIPQPTFHEVLGVSLPIHDNLFPETFTFQQQWGSIVRGQKTIPSKHRFDEKFLASTKRMR